MPLLLLLFLGPLSLFSQTRDYWLKTERKGQAYAYEHITVTNLPDGNLRLDSSSHAKTDFFGFNAQDIVGTSSCVVDPELRPLSFESRVKSQTNDTYARNGSVLGFGNWRHQKAQILAPPSAEGC